MTNTIRQHPWIEKISGPWIARGLAFLGALFALVRQWRFSLAHNSLMDEGEYLLKGYLFATGQYRPFEEFGLWTNHMPLSFLIPGWVERLFGAGLLTGRLYALGLNLLILLGLWLVCRRVSNSWVAAGIIWLWALNSASLKIYSTATSQGLITAMLIWILFLILGPRRPPWQIVAGGSLAGLMLLTRLNIAPALPIILVYIFWQHGSRAGWRAALAMGATALAGHLIFWPGILRMWAAWLPPSLTPFLAPFRPPEGLPAWNPTLDGASRLLSFWFAVRYHFLALFGLLLVLLAWPESAEDKAGRKTATFLAVLFGALLAAHAWASLGTHGQTDSALGNDYCIFCFPIYSAFFSILGYVLLAQLVGARFWSRPVPGWAAAPVVLLLPAGVGYGAYKTFGTSLTHLRVPRLRTLLQSGVYEPGIPLWDVLSTRYGVAIETTRRLAPLVGGLLVGALILLAAWLLVRRSQGKMGFGQASLAGVFLLGLVLTPTPLLSGGYQDYDCPGNVIAAYESAGAYLQSLIPAGARVYWQGSLSSAPLVYLEAPRLLPGQINQDYTYRLSGDDREHLRFGYWSRPLAQEWLSQADFVLVSERNLSSWLAEALQNPEAFRELPATVPLAPCDPGSGLRVFARAEAP
jgi:hypothetical protein